MKCADVKKTLCLSSGKSSKQKEYNTQIKQYKWTQRSGSKNVTFFSQPHPRSSIKARALSWSWNGNKQPPGEVPGERSQQQQTWQACACQKFSHTMEGISSLSSHQLLLNFEAEFLPPWEAEGHKRLSCPLIGFSTMLKPFHIIFFSPYPSITSPLPYKITRPRLCEHRVRSSKIKVLPP